MSGATKVVCSSPGAVWIPSTTGTIAVDSGDDERGLDSFGVEFLEQPAQKRHRMILRMLID